MSEAYLMILTLVLQQQHGRRGQQQSLPAVRRVSAAAKQFCQASCLGALSWMQVVLGRRWLPWLANYRPALCLR